MGTGEGLVETFVQRVDEPDPNEPKRTTKVVRQVRNNGLFIVDEISTLDATQARQSSTIVPTLNSAWMGETLGGKNATIEATRRVAPDSYTVGLVVGIQVERGQDVLGHAATGLPQRMGFFSAHDWVGPGSDDEPGGLRWRPPAAREHLAATRGYYKVDSAIVVEVRKQHDAVMAGTVVLDPLDTHAGLMRMKTASLLSLLCCNQGHVDRKFWDLAGVVLAHSSAVRSLLIEAQQAKERARDEAAERIAVSRAVRVEAAKEGRLLATVRDKVLVAVKANPEGITRMEVRTRLSAKQREFLDVVIEDLVERAFITVIEEAGQGQSKKVLRLGTVTPLRMKEQVRGGGDS